MILAMAPVMAEDLSPRHKAMGGVGIAVIDDSQSYPNPASVYFYSADKAFLLETSASDLISRNALPYVPATFIKGSFTGERLALNLCVSFEAQNPQPDGAVDIFQTTTIDINLSAGYGPIGVGFGISGGSIRQRLDVPMDTVPDYFMQFFFSQFDRVVNSEFLQARAGFLFRNGQLSLGLLLDDILDKDGTKTTLSWASLFEHAGLGAYWTRDEYSRRGKMNNLIYSFALEVNNLFRNSTRCLNTGAELAFRLVRDFSVSLRGGFSSTFRDFSSCTWTLGLGLNIDALRVCANFFLPHGQSSSFELTAVFQI